MDAETIILPIRPEWRAAAAYAGHPDLAEWLRDVVDDFLETGPGRFFPLLPLEWHERDFAAVRSTDGRNYTPHPVSGPVAGPFGIYRGAAFFLPDRVEREHGGVFTLAHVPTGRGIATLTRVRDCKRLAEELAALPHCWHSVDPEKIIGNHENGGPYREIVHRYRIAALPPRLRGRDFLPEDCR